LKNWPIKQQTAKIAASNAVKVRAALLASIDTNKVATDFMDSHPTVTDDVTADRQNARQWAKINVITNSVPLKSALNRIHAEGWVTGDKGARASIRTAALNKAPSLAKIIRDPKANAWTNWKPGNEAAAALLNPPGGLRALLDASNITIREIDRTSLDRLGTILADGLRTGQAAGKTATEIRSFLADTVSEDYADPSRALTIALTETSRAVNQAALNRYQESMIDQVEWLGIEPCEICAENDGQVVGLGESFPSGDDAPPAHPNCVCTLLPVIPAMADIELGAKPDLDLPTKAGVPGPLEIEAALSRLDILPNPIAGSVDEPEKWVESFWETVPVPTVDPNIWSTAKVVVVKLQDLTGTDEILKRKKLKEHIEVLGQSNTPNRSFALVGRTNDQLIILDGHHRLAAMWLLGMDSAPVWVAEI
jgi:SPP1 gp7 family putative phage head morphogenesis protein